MALSITWLGHSTFIVGTPGGKRVLFDLSLNQRTDLVLVTGGRLNGIPAVFHGGQPPKSDGIHFTSTC